MVKSSAPPKTCSPPLQHSTGNPSVKYPTRSLKPVLVLALVAIAVGMLANPGAASAGSVKIVGAADANITGSTVNSYSPYSYGLMVNAFNGTHAIVDVPLAAVPLNATVSGVQVNFAESSYANANGLVTISGYGRTGSIIASEGAARLRWDHTTRLPWESGNNRWL